MCGPVAYAYDAKLPGRAARPPSLERPPVYPGEKTERAVQPSLEIASASPSAVPEFDDIGTVVLRAVDRDPVLCSRHDARFRLLSAQEKTLASCGSQGLSAGWG